MSSEEAPMILARVGRAAKSAVLGAAFVTALGWGLWPGQEGAVAEAIDCPDGMVSINGDFCIDQFEASVVEIDKPRTKRHKPETVKKHSPFKPIDGRAVKAVSKKGQTPQGYISRDEAEQACINAGKRLCSNDEWLTACRGKKPTKYPYGDDHVEGRCNDKGLSSFNLTFGPGNNEPPTQDAYSTDNMNDPRLNAMAGTVAKTGSFGKCRNAYKVYDMVGNLHEWTSDPGGTFRGGYYLDTQINGEGCDYKTTAHNARYHDYSTGFRCCYGGAAQKQIEAALPGKKKSAKDDDKKSAKSKDKPKDKSKKSAAKAPVREPTLADQDG